MLVLHYLLLFAQNSGYLSALDFVVVISDRNKAVSQPRLLSSLVGMVLPFKGESLVMDLVRNSTYLDTWFATCRGAIVRIKRHK